MAIGIGGAAEIGGAVGGAITGLISLFRKKKDPAKALRKAALDVFRKIESPDFNIEDLKGPELRIAATMRPEVFQAQDAGRPELIRGAPDVREQQLRALSGLRRTSEEGIPLVDRLAAEEAGRSVSGALRRGEESAIRGLRRRGRLGSGAETQARIVGGRQASELARGLGSDLARSSLLRRQQALRDYATASGSLRGQDIGVEASRADAMNRFAQFAATQRQSTEEQNARARERAQFYNVSQTQNVANINEMAKYQAQIEQNRLRQMQYQNEITKAGQMAGQYGQLATGAEAGQAAKDAAFQQIGLAGGQLLGGAGAYAQENRARLQGLDQGPQQSFNPNPPNPPNPITGQNEINSLFNRLPPRTSKPVEYYGQY